MFRKVGIKVQQHGNSAKLGNEFSRARNLILRRDVSRLESF